MNKCYVTYSSLITPLGNSPAENLLSLKNGISGIQMFDGQGFAGESLPLAKITSLRENERFSSLLSSACEALRDQTDAKLLSSSKTLLILSTTKADLSVFPGDTFQSAENIFAEKLKLAHRPLIISNACISGVVAINTAADYIHASLYDQVIVLGIDVLSPFITYGFQSLFALSDETARPFDKQRKGISLGEACGCVIVSRARPETAGYTVMHLGGSSSNDANHISGPSRTGEGLVRSVRKTLERTAMPRTEIDFVSAHGTGTLFNDEMESIAFQRLEMDHIALNSFKGTVGHTLGAAGIIETIFSMFSMEENLLFQSQGFAETGTSYPLNIITENRSSEVNTVLKTASGFGGGNASLILQKI